MNNGFTMFNCGHARFFPNSSTSLVLLAGYLRTVHKNIKVKCVYATRTKLNGPKNDNDEGENTDDETARRDVCYIDEKLYIYYIYLRTFDRLALYRDKIRSSGRKQKQCSTALTIPSGLSSGSNLM